MIDQHENELVKFEDLPSIKEGEIEKMILNEQERSFKDRVWKNLNKQWITDQNDRKRLKKLELKQRRALKATSSFASSSQIESEP